MTEEEQNKKRYGFAKRTMLHPCNPKTVVLVSGEDALEFLQGQITQDLSGVDSDSPRYGFWLNQKGRVLGDAVVTAGLPETLRIFSWSMAAAETIERLEAYIIADDVELEDETSAWQGWQVAGQDVEEWLKQWRKAAAGDEGVGWAEANPLAPGSIRVVAKSSPEWPATWQEGSAEGFERARIAAGIPLIPVDLGEGDFPQEARMESLGVSFSKGCYLGQEVMARLANTGRVRRRLGRIKGEGSVPAGEKVELTQHDKRVGELRSGIDDGAEGWMGMAMISLANFQPDQALILPDGRSVQWLEREEGSS